MRNAITIVNARAISPLRIVGTKIAALNAASQPGDVIVDLQGERLLPGLINAHDHLQLNALPRLKYREAYANAAQWIDDIRPRLESDPMFVANRAVRREDRLLIGGIKNLLSGVTTVAHHDPLYPSLTDADFPVRVVNHYGWSHSLLLDGGDKVRRAWRATPADQPWIIHASEGTDGAAAEEFDRLEALGCIAANTLIVHGVGLTSAQQHRLLASGASVIWCPSSNLHLFGRTLESGPLFDAGRVALGSDSRLSGGHDFLSEMQTARHRGFLDDAGLEGMVTEQAAELLRLTDRGVLRPGMLADLIVVPEGSSVSELSRADVRAVMIGGELRYADPDLVDAFEASAHLERVSVDGRVKCLAKSLAERLRQSRIGEPGLDLVSRNAAPGRTVSSASMP